MQVLSAGKPECSGTKNTSVRGVGEGKGRGVGCLEDENLETGKWTRLKYFIGPSASHPSTIERKSIMV